MAELDENLVRAPGHDEHLVHRANQHHHADEGDESDEDLCYLRVEDDEVRDLEQHDHHPDRQGDGQVSVAVVPCPEHCLFSGEVGGEILVH